MSDDHAMPSVAPDRRGAWPYPIRHRSRRI